MKNRTSKERCTALCCVCGQKRIVTEWDSWGEASPDEVYGFRHAYGRCYVWRKCSACDRQTQHAYLRSGDGRDEIELLMIGVDVVRTAESIIADLQVPSIMQWMSDRNVRVEWGRDAGSEQPIAKLTRYLDDGTFFLTLPSKVDSLTLNTLLRQAVQIVEAPESWLLWCVIPADASNPPIAFCPLVPPAKRA